MTLSRPELLQLLEALDAAACPYQARNGRLMLHKNAVISEELATLVEANREALGEIVKEYRHICFRCRGLITGTLLASSVEAEALYWHPWCVEARQR